MDDIAIIGAGPAGSAAAITAAHEGLRVALIDKAQFPRNKTCGDALTPRALGQLAHLDVDITTLDSHWLLPGDQSMVVRAPNGRAVVLSLPVTGEWPRHIALVPRRDLDAHLVEQAIAAGARYEQAAITELVQNANGVTLHSSDGVVATARFAVLATGAAVPLLKQSGFLSNTPPTALAARAYVEGITNLHTQQIELRFDVPLPGYGWVFPTSSTTANIGLGIFPKRLPFAKSPQHPKQAFDRFLNGLHLDGTLSVSPVQGYPIRMDFPSTPAARGRLLVAGEAAGLVNPLTGDGIDFALESGRIAAYTVADALRQETWQRAIDTYQPTLRKHFGSLFGLAQRMQWLLNSATVLNTLIGNAQTHPDGAQHFARLLLASDNPATMLDHHPGVRQLLLRP